MLYEARVIGEEVRKLYAVTGLIALLGIGVAVSAPNGKAYQNQGKQRQLQTNYLDSFIIQHSRSNGSSSHYPFK